MTTLPSSQSRSENLLVVDPDPLFRLLLCAFLSDRLADFHSVASFDEARALLSDHNFAAVIAEYHLPGGTGLSLYDEARQTFPEVPFVLMCGGTSVAISDPHFRFLAKPFALRKLADALSGMSAANSLS